jgi:sirohydrochlorin ferrochelatase
VVLVPLLLGSGFHSRSDVPDIIATAAARHPELRVTRSDVLGARPERLVDALRQRVRAAGVDAADPGVGVAVVGAGSSRASGRAATEAAAEALAAATAWSALPCFASAAGPRPGEAVDELAARGCHTVVAAPWVLAPGKLTDKVAAALAERLARPEIRLAAPIGACPQLAATIADRFAAALPQGPPASTSTEAPAPAF